MGQLLSRKKLLEKQKLRIEKVNLKDGDFVYVKEMTAGERDLFEKSILKAKFGDDGEFKGVDQSFDNYRAKLAVITICDENSNLLLSPEDYKELANNIGAHCLEEIINKAQELNAISPKDKKNLLKNSKAGQVVNSSLDSVEN